MGRSCDIYILSLIDQQLTHHSGHTTPPPNSCLGVTITSSFPPQSLPLGVPLFFRGTSLHKFRGFKVKGWPGSPLVKPHENTDSTQPITETEIKLLDF